MSPEQDFLKRTKNYNVEILSDNGVNRTIKVHQPNTSAYHFYVTTWPGHLCISGDMGDYVFARLEDMFEFFNDEGGEINPRYWGEKLTSIDKYCGHKEFDGDLFIKKLIEQFPEKEDEIEYAEVYDGEDRAIESASVLTDDPHIIYDVAEVSRVFTYHYLWCLHAIVWTIKQYDEMKENDNAH